MSWMIASLMDRLRPFLFGTPIVPMRKLQKSSSKKGVSGIEKVGFGFVTFLRKKENTKI
jgi:hypothetical protein